MALRTGPVGLWHEAGSVLSMAGRAFGRARTSGGTVPWTAAAACLALKALGVGPAGAAVSADLGGSSKYSSEILED